MPIHIQPQGGTLVPSFRPPQWKENTIGRMVSFFVCCFFMLNTHQKQLRVIKI